MLSSLIILFATILYCALHSLTASNQMKSRLRDRFGPEADRWYRLSYNILAGISFLPIVWLLAILPDKPLYTIPLPWMLLTTVGQVTGAVIIVVGIGQTDAFTFMGIRQLLPQDHSQEGAGFVNTGLYGWVRHPLYTGGLIIIWLAPSMTINLLTLFIILTIYFIVGARFEEERFVEEYGEAYRRYQQLVPLLLPTPRRREKKPELG